MRVSTVVEWIASVGAILGGLLGLSYRADPIHVNWFDPWVPVASFVSLVLGLIGVALLIGRPLLRRNGDGPEAYRETLAYETLNWAGQIVPGVSDKAQRLALTLVLRNHNSRPIKYQIESVTLPSDVRIPWPIVYTIAPGQALNPDVAILLGVPLPFDVNIVFAVVVSYGPIDAEPVIRASWRLHTVGRIEGPRASDAVTHTGVLDHQETVIKPKRRLLGRIRR